MATIIGNNDDNVLRGTGDRDRIEGRGGDDLLLGRGDRDDLLGDRATLRNEQEGCSTAAAAATTGSLAGPARTA